MEKQLGTRKETIYFNSDNLFTVQEGLGIKALTFAWMPSWWKQQYGIVMGERYCMDWKYRVKAAAEMERKLAERFSMMKMGQSEVKEGPVAPNWINATTVAAAGGKVLYSEDNFPTTRHLTMEQLENLKVPDDVTKIFPYDETIRQVKEMNEFFGTDMKPHLFKNGVSNDVVQLIGGDEAMLEMMDESDLFYKVIDYSLEMWEKVMEFNFTQGSMPDIYMWLLCTAQLIGPELYEKYFFEHDLKVLDIFNRHNQKFQLHHCGKFDPFIKLYRKIPHVDMIQIGFTSDPKPALEAFPEADIEFIYSPYEVLHKTKEEIRERTMWILERAKGHEERFSIVVADMEADVRDENIVEIYNCCKEW